MNRALETWDQIQEKDFDRLFQKYQVLKKKKI